MIIMKKRIIVIAILIGAGIFAASHQAAADTDKLIGSLTDLLGVSGEQATGGAGAVFREAKNNMSAADYSQLLSAIPGIDTLIQAAPEVSNLAGSASSLLGGSSGTVKGISALTDSFAKLGLSPDMVNKYVDVILNFVQSEAGQQTMTMLKSALL
jgi:hypothetical protein